MHVEDIKHKNYTIKVNSPEYLEDSIDNPRVAWDNLGTMICFHSRYTLGDEHNYSVEEAKEIQNNKNNICLSLNLYDHSGISMSVSNSYPYNDRWDAGCVGFIYVSKNRVRSDYGWKKITKKRLERIVTYLKNEVEIYDDYLTGAVYGFEILDPEGNEVEDGSHYSGYYGYDHEKSGLMSEAISIIEYEIENKRKARHEKLKNLIINKVPTEKRADILGV